MTETELETLVVRLTGDPSGYQKMLNNAVQQTHSAVKEITGAFAGISTAMGAGNALNAFNTLTDNFVRMEEAAKLNGLAVRETIKDYKDFAQIMEDTTRGSKVEALSLVALANSYGLVGEKAKEAVRMATSIAALNPGMSTAGALRAVSMYQKTGYTRQLAYMLGLYGMGAGEGGIRRGANSPEMRAEIQKRLNQGWEVAVRLSKTLGGQLISLRSHFKDLEVEIGKIVGDFIQPLVKWTNKLVDWFIELDPLVKKIVLGTVALGAALALVTPTLTLLSMILGSVASGFMALTTLLSWPVLLGVGSLSVVVAIIVRRLGGIEAAWQKIQDGAKLAWGYIKAYFHAFVRWATPYWNTFTAFLSRTWDKVYKSGLNAWEKIKEKAQAFFKWAFPIAQAWWSFQKALWETMPQLATAAWNYIEDVAGSAISGILKALNDIDWQAIQDTIVSVFLAAEFTLRNFGKVWDTIVVGMLYAFVKFTNQVKFFFTDVLPEIFRYSLRVHVDLLQASRRVWEAYFMALARSALIVGKAITEMAINPFKRNKVNISEQLKQVWGQFGKDFVDTMRNIPLDNFKLPERIPDMLEQQLKGAFDKQKGALGQSFDEFKKEKLKEFGKVGLSLIPPELVKETDKQAKQIGMSLTEPFKESDKEIKKWEASIYGSADYYKHATEYMSKLDEMFFKQRHGFTPGGGEARSGEGGVGGVGGTGGGMDLSSNPWIPDTFKSGGTGSSTSVLSALKTLTEAVVLDRRRLEGLKVVVVGGPAKIKP